MMYIIWAGLAGINYDEKIIYDWKSQQLSCGEWMMRELVSFYHQITLWGTNTGPLDERLNLSVLVDDSMATIRDHMTSNS
jgi:hypothetical protein